MTHRWRLVVRAARTALFSCVLCLLAACATTGGGGGPAVPETTPAPVTLDHPPSLVVEAIVTDKKGAPAQDLRVTDFEVVVDGRRRPGLALGRMFRGPGADFAAASRGPGGPGEVLPLSEPSRVIVIVIDQASFSPGDERIARTAAEACINLLGLSDRLAVVTLPPREGTTTIDFERVDAVKMLAGLRPMWGRAGPPLNADEPGMLPGAAGADAAARAAMGGDARAGEAGRGEAERDPDRPAAPMPGAETIPPAVLKAHASSTLAMLGQIARSLASMPGGKTILFFSAGLVATDLSQELAAAAALAARSHTRIVGFQVPSQTALREIGGHDLGTLALSTGGRVVGLPGKPQQAMERLASELSFSYLLMLAPMPGDGDPSPHAVTVTLKRRTDLTLQAPRQVLPWRIPPDALATALSPRAQMEARRATAPPPPSPPPAAGTSGGPRPLPGFALFQHDRSVDLVVARVSQYAWDYGRELSSIVSEETYKQEVKGEAAPKVVLNGKDVQATGQRRLISDYLLVKIPGMDGWLPFRDVFEVDGKPVRDREDRLVKLFLDAPSPEVAIERGNQVLRESARYNIGPVVRTLNVPTLPLWFLEPANVRRFAFRKVEETKLNGKNAVVLEFTERVRPTFVRTSAGQDIPVLGRVWVDPVNGQIFQTRIGAYSATITVTYGQTAEIPGLWLPESMQERYVAGKTEITASATYAKYRRFRVLTTEQVNVPKK
jgi:VWFA-related protein